MNTMTIDELRQRMGNQEYANALQRHPNGQIRCYAYWYIRHTERRYYAWAETELRKLQTELNSNTP